jgi:hypothetical protein
MGSTSRRSALAALVSLVSLASLASLAVVGGATSGCGGAGGPTDPVWGKQPCGHCAMVVSERRHAAQATVDGGPPLYFDDLGCLALWLEGHAGAKAWARDAEGRWVDATQARYATGAKTPMGFGFETDPKGAASWADVVRESKSRSKGKAKGGASGGAHEGAGHGPHDHGGH